MQGSPLRFDDGVRTTDDVDVTRGGACSALRDARSRSEYTLRRSCSAIAGPRSHAELEQ